MTSARDLTVRLADLLSRERAALAEFLVALAEFDRERRWVELGYASLFDFLHRELGLSKGAAFYRKTAAALIQRFPAVIDPLRDGRLCLTSIVELSKVLTPENRDTVLPRFFHLSKAQAKEVSAEICPARAAPHREVVTAVRSAAIPRSIAAAGPQTQLHGYDRPSRSSARLDELAADERQLAVHPDELPADRRQLAVHPGELVVDQRQLTVHPGEPIVTEGPTVAQLPSGAGSRPAADPLPRSARAPETSLEPLTADLRRMHITVSRAFLRKLEQARDALSHSHPGADAQAILEAGLDLLLERHAKRNGKTDRPRREPPASRPDHVPAHVRRAVWERDGGRCQWKLESGEICGSTCRVQLDHVDPKGRGGAATVDRMRLLCIVHNQRYARLVYGDAWMDRFTRGRGPRQRARAPAEGSPSRGNVVPPGASP